MKQHILYGAEARAAIKRGIDKAADAAKVTLGPIGHTAIIDTGTWYPNITDDGVTVLRHIDLDDPIENVGAKLMKEVAIKANDAAGDGTTTATVLAQALAAEAFRVINEDPSKVQAVKEELASGLKAAKEQLDAMARPVDTADEIRRVAEISSLDPEIADVISQAIDKLGKNAVITVEESPVPGVSIETVKGMRISSGLVNEFFITNQERNEGTLTNPKILVTDKRIGDAKALGVILEKLYKNGVQDFVLFADEITGEALATLIVNAQRGIYRCLAIAPPFTGARRLQAFEDIAALTGATLLSEKLGMKLVDFDLPMLGSAERVTATKGTTTIVGGAGNPLDRVLGLESELAEAKASYDQETLRERISGLSGGIGVIRVGTFSETEAKARRYKIEDSLHATRAAIEEGVVPGGGAALLSLTGKVGSPILDAALGAPYAQMAVNSGRTGQNHVSNLPGESAFDWKEGKIVDAYVSGILDPVKVTKSSLESAVSVVSTALTVGTLIVIEPDNAQ